MALDERRRKPWSLVLTLIALALIVYGCILSLSSVAIMSSYEQARAAYERYEGKMEQTDYQGAATDLIVCARGIHDINHHLHQWPWTVASHMPYVGTDINCTREIARIADRMAGDVLVPVITGASGIFGETQSQGVVGLFTERAVQIAAPSQVALSARDTVATCSIAAEELPEPHFEVTKRMVSELRSALAEAQELFELLDPVLSVVDKVDAVVDVLT